MKIKAIRSVELKDHIYCRGEIANYDGPIDSRIAYNFVAEDGSELIPNASAKPADVDDAQNAKAKIAKTVAVMKRDGIRQALDAMNITYSASSNTEYLAKLLLINKGEIEE